ncbi:hypothetical protein [Candidatus Marinarcus aquaticus]|uniref:Uncharacterized protein n=1 Tax=Candidatus Marinarcus aquaticus TaxID=2044504 RepID=A0A4V1LP56_9BACT|nr:hypothetical protein [Candidatus Marinarcus aquaticus]RXJ60028.1 hypothetical protein CRV04_03160 [Candidatus Marinarcus aquaticus]
MIIELITIALLLIMVIMQFFVNKITKIVAIFTGIILLILQSHNTYQTYLHNKSVESKLNDIKSSVEFTIDWQKSKPKLEFMTNNIDENIANRLVVPIKVFSLDNLKLSTNMNVDFQKIIENAYENSVFKYKELRSEDALKIFNLFTDTDGNIYQDIEEKANIGHLYLMPRVVKNNYLDFGIQYSGMEPLGNFNTLQKLNNTILITRVPALGDVKTFNFIKSLQLNLETDQGIKRLYFSSRRSDKDRKLKIIDYMGIYIPKGFFK